MTEFELFTYYPLATSSRDYIVPGGTMMDDTKNINFVKKCISLFTERYCRPFALLDMGCSSGGLVEQVIQQGEGCHHPVTAVGLEGSDYSLSRHRGAWDRIDNLFTCDITQPFTICASNVIKHLLQTLRLDSERKEKFFDEIVPGIPFRFDVITAWEVMEHILPESLPVLFKNVHRHLMPDGLWMMSVSSQRGYHHRTAQDINWWMSAFDKAGFICDNEAEQLISPDWPRGPEDPDSFNCVLRKKKDICFPVV